MAKVVRTVAIIAAVAVNVIPGVGQALSIATLSAMGAGFVSATLAAVLPVVLQGALTLGLTAASPSTSSRTRKKAEAAE